MADPGVRDGREPLTGHEKYEKLKDLSAGAFGFVQLARNKRTGQHVAIKFLERVRDFPAPALPSQCKSQSRPVLLFQSGSQWRACQTAGAVACQD